MKNLYKILIFTIILISSDNLLSQTFDTITVNLPGIDYSSAIWGDYDNDGYLDILLSGRTANNSFITKIYKNNGDNIFSEQTGISIQAVYQGSAAWGDYNNDGYLDLIIAGASGLAPDYNPVTKIYKNNGNNTFSEQTDFTLTGVCYSSVDWADFDKDGDLDCIIVGENRIRETLSKIYWNVNNQFQETNIYLKGGEKLAVIDYNNDNYPDILISGRDINGNYHSTIYTNNKNQTFTEQKHISFISPFLFSLTTRDYDNDGHLDILFTGYGENSVPVSKLYKNNGDNTFTEQDNITLPGLFFSAVAWGDYNNDGNSDILFTGYDENANRLSKIYKNNGNNTFTEQVDISLEEVITGFVSWGDYDNDGDLDILLTGMSNAGTRISKIYRNNASISNSIPEVPQNLQHEIQGNQIRLMWDPSSDAETPSQSLSYNVRVSSINETRDIVSPMADSSTGYKRIPCLGNTYLNTEFILNNLDTGAYFWCIQTLDNGFLSSVFSEKISFNILPEFSLVADISLTGLHHGASAWCDYDNDGNLDIILTGLDEVNTPTSEIYKNNGPSAYGFTVQSNISLPDIWQSDIAWGDYDNDGYIDFLLLGDTSKSSDRIPYTKIYKNNGDNSFTEQTDISLTDVYGGSAAWGDYDNDGDLDILLTGQTVEAIPVSKTYKNNAPAANGFSEQSSISIAGVWKSDVAWGDCDNDGFLDILITGETADSVSVSRIYKNKGDNTFTEQTDISLTDVNSGSVAWGDYNSDGNLDILLTGQDENNNSVLNIYRNDGNDIFTNIETYIRKITNGSVAWGDYDNDGFSDIIITGNSGTRITKVYHNNQDGTFSDINADLYNVNGGSLSWGDYDNDGDLDILLSGEPIHINAASKIYRNNTNYPNNLPKTPDNLQSELSGFDLKLSWNKATDPDYSEGNLYYNLRIGSPG